MDLRVGQGYDIHQLAPNRKLMLGGVEVPHDLGCLGHSDADPLLHALIDALFGAAALGDIGRHFPDTDPAYKGVSSIELLKSAKVRIEKAGFSIVNVDSTIIAQAPKLAGFIGKMRGTIAGALEISSSRINVKAKTNEKMDSLGQQQAIAAMAVVLLIKS